MVNHSAIRCPPVFVYFQRKYLDYHDFIVESLNVNIPIVTLFSERFKFVYKISEVPAGI